jgi:hypothetical protein
MKEIKAIDRWLTSLQPFLESADIDSIKSKLANNLTSDVLTRFRERKLILKVPFDARGAVVQALYESAEKSVGSSEREGFFRYLKFLITVESSRLRSLQQMHSVIQECPRCSLMELLEFGQLTFDWLLSKLGDLDDVLQGVSVAHGELNFHELNGVINDTATAIARTVNEWSRVNEFSVSNSLSQQHMRRVFRMVRQIVKLAGEVNTFEWLIDGVTFGDFIVEESVATPLMAHRLDFADPRRQLLRRLAIRRELVMKFSQRRARRYVREQLLSIETRSLTHATEYYLYKSGRPLSTKVDLKNATVQSNASLILVDAEDDLLLAAAQLGPEVQGYYLGAMSMRWFAAGSQAVHETLGPLGRDKVHIPVIPLKEIAKSFDDGAGGARIRAAMDDQLCQLPSRNHHALVSRPFLRADAHSALPLLGGHLGIWNLSVREALIKGGMLGKNFGAIWEDFLSKQFEGTDWKVVRRNVKLKKDGKLITDVDLILLRNDLLLIVQIKALIGSGITIYDHWKNRQTIQFGCSQAKIAVDFLNSNTDWLISICGKKAATGIKFIQPVVLTNIDQLNGWIFEEVPVISEVTRKAICYGSKVDYFDAHTGAVKHTHHFVKKDELNTDTIQRLLKHSVELDISAELEDVTYRKLVVGDCCFFLPEFAVREATASHFGPGTTS